MSEIWSEHIKNGQREFRRSFDGQLMVIRPVSPKMNKSSYNEPDCVEPLAASA
jgi:hypothetical protein